MLGVFLFTAFTRLGHECQGLLSPCDGIYVCRLDLGLYSYPKEVFFFFFFWGGGGGWVESGLLPVKGPLPHFVRLMNANN